MMFLPISASLFSLMVLADGVSVPDIDPEPACHDAAMRAVPVGDVEICLRKESEARHELVRKWDLFNDAEKATCIPLHTAGGAPTYTELLTCLEVMREACSLHEKRTTGAARQDGR
jgi:hypothetical protein